MGEDQTMPQAVVDSKSLLKGLRRGGATAALWTRVLGLGIPLLTTLENVMLKSGDIGGCVAARGV